MTAHIKTAEVTDLVSVLATCSQVCRAISASSAIEIARDHSLPDVPKLVRLVNDCAASCDIAILLIERKSHIVTDFLQICEELAMECAWQCSNYNFEVCRECTAACELVAKNCLPFIAPLD